MRINWRRCLPCYSARSTSPEHLSRPLPPRCLLLGPASSGKTTFLFRMKTGEFFNVSPTDGVNVEEILISPISSHSIIFSDIGDSSRREARLHFMNSVPIQELCILFFIDVSAPLDTLPQVLDDLVYHVTYARNRAGGIRYVGVVLNKQDRLKPSEANNEDETVDREITVATIKAQVEAAMENVVTTPLMNGKMEECDTSWEVLDGVGTMKGISTKTGAGVKDVFERVVAAVWGDRARLKSLAIGEPVKGPKLL